MHYGPITLHVVTIRISTVKLKFNDQQINIPFNNICFLVSYIYIIVWWCNMNSGIQWNFMFCFSCFIVPLLLVTISTCTYILIYIIKIHRYCNVHTALYAYSTSSILKSNILQIPWPELENISWYVVDKKFGHWSKFNSFQTTNTYTFFHRESQLHSTTVLLSSDFFWT